VCRKRAVARLLLVRVVRAAICVSGRNRVLPVAGLAGPGPGSGPL